MEGQESPMSPNIEDDVGDEGNTNLSTFKNRSMPYKDDKQMIINMNNKIK
jgi:hypothetical protein